MIDLRLLKRDDLLSIAYNVGQFYKNAYQIDVSDEVITQLFKKLHKHKTRLFIKYIIEALDVLRFNPEKTVKDLI
jgi:hypothetical protein